MMQCQSCGDVEGPWIYSQGAGILCEDCYNYKETCDQLVNLIRTHRATKGKSTLDIVAFMDGIENRVYDELGLQ